MAVFSEKPYHPSYNNPFIQGNASLWGIPVSSFILPFMSNVGMALGKTIEKLFFKFLYTESTMFNKPVVYLLHPEDISENPFGLKEKFQYEFRWRHLFPSKEYGFAIRYAIFHNKDPKKISKNIIDLLKIIKNHKNISFLTYKKMIALLKNNYPVH